MNLTDVEKAVVELSSRHPDLTKEFLRTLLEASGWEGKHIKEAEVILAARLAMTRGQDTTSNIPPVPTAQNNDFTFYHPDGSEEGELVLPEDVVVKRAEDEVVVSPVNEAHEEQVQTEHADVPLFVDIDDKVENAMINTIRPSEPESWIKEEIPVTPEEPTALKREPVKWQTQRADIPENLPLVPFESSPHIWSFGRYKDTFHPIEQVQPARVEEPVTPPVAVQKTAPVQVPVKEELKVEPVVVTIPKSAAEAVEIDFEKTPITRGDESLVVLAGIMLLAIMLILGYMYSNGRL